MEEFAGMGSFGAVYRATDMRLGRPVAVKILRPDIADEEASTARELFQREALTAGRLLHPNVVAVTDVGEESGYAYLVMEWLEGRTLEDELRSHSQLSVEQTATLLAPIADALQTAHDLNIIHRDIKPSNIHLGKHGRTNVKVLDFGIAKVVASSTAAFASRIAGTLYYMSPEQISGGKIDRRSDVYALGVVLYQMLCGKLPFTGETQGQIIQQHLSAPPPALIKVHSVFAPALSRVISRALAKSPEQRQGSAQELYSEFVAALSNHQFEVTIIEDEPSERKAVTVRSPERPGAGLIPSPAAPVSPPETTPNRIPATQSPSSYEPGIGGLAKTAATLLGLVFMLIGSIGFIIPSFLGTHLTTSHNLVHIISGTLSLYFGLAGTMSAARLFCIVFGFAYGLLGVAGFALGSGPDRMFEFMASLGLHFGTMDHVINILLGFVFLIGALLTGPISRSQTGIKE
jgi:eukaryotic-like serine/threonine-protein kinase